MTYTKQPIDAITPEMVEAIISNICRLSQTTQFQDDDTQHELKNLILAVCKSEAAQRMITAESGRLKVDRQDVTAMYIQALWVGWQLRGTVEDSLKLAALV